MPTIRTCFLSENRIDFGLLKISAEQLLDLEIHAPEQDRKSLTSVSLTGPKLSQGDTIVGDKQGKGLWRTDENTDMWK